MDAKLRLTSVAETDGEVVWSWRPDAGVKFVRSKLLKSDGGNKAGHRGEREVSRKPLRGEGRDVSASPVVIPLCILVQNVPHRGLRVPAGTRSSLRPLLIKRAETDAKLGRFPSRECGRAPSPLFDN